MLSTLNFLIHGETTEQQNRKLKNLEKLFLINKNKPLRDAAGKPLSIRHLTHDLNERLMRLKLDAFRSVVFEILGKLENHDNALHYFVLVTTYRLSDDNFGASLKEMAMQQKLVTRVDGKYKNRLFSSPNEQNNIPQLAWDITPVLKTIRVAEKDVIVPSTSLLNILYPVDDWGLISRDYRSVLTCEELNVSAREGNAIEFFHLDQHSFYQYLLDMYRGISSDLFQLDSDKNFYQSKPCRVEEWNLSTTHIVHLRHILLANQLSETIRNLKNLFITETSNSVRLLIQKYLIDEQHIFSEYFDMLLGSSSDFQFRSIFENFPNLNLQSSDLTKFEVCDQIYEIVSAYYYVIREMNAIVRNINDYSPILLNEMSFLGSQSAPQFYSRQMWRRVNVSLICFIVNKLAEMLTTPEAELMELLTDAGDAKMIKDPSIWQRLNPLTMESSQCIEEPLANRVADLIIGFQFFINDKKNRSRQYDEYTFTISDIKDAEELELFAKTPQFEKVVSEILSEVDVCSFNNSLGELSTCIIKLLDKVPTKKIVEKYSSVVFDKSIRFFEFLKKFFTTAYIHLKDKSISSQSTFDFLELEKMHKQGYDSEFLKTVGYDLNSTLEDFLLTVNPPEPLNVFVSAGVTEIYSQVFTVLNLLHTALDHVIEARTSETLEHEPRLRYAFFHMDTTVFAIRKNILTLIEASFEALLKTLNCKELLEYRSSHESLNVCYRAHRKFIREVAGALMLNSKRGTTGRVVRLIVGSVTQASKACLNGDAVGADNHYKQFRTNLLIFLDQCRLDHIRYPLYRSLEIGCDEMDGQRSLNSSFSDDLSCRSY